MTPHGDDPIGSLPGELARDAGYIDEDLTSSDEAQLEAMLDKYERGELSNFDAFAAIPRNVIRAAIHRTSDWSTTPTKKAEK